MDHIEIPNGDYAHRKNSILPDRNYARRPFVPMEIGHGRGVDVVLPQPFTKRAKKKHEEEEAAKERRKRRSEPATTGGCIDFRFISLVAFVGEISLVGPLVKIALSN